MLGACGGRSRPHGRELAKTDAVPLEAQLWGTNLVVKAADPNEDLASDAVSADGAHDVLLSIPKAGGHPTELARMPAGDFRVGPRGIALVAKGQLAILRTDGGRRNVAKIAPDAADPIWVDTGIVVIADNVINGGECCDLTLVAMDGSTRSIGKLKGVGDARVVVADDESYIADAFTGETVRIDAAGNVTQIASPATGPVSCIAVTHTHVWWGHWPEKGHFVISAMPRAGGPAAVVTDFSQTNGVDCAGGPSELFYSQGNRIMGVSPTKQPREIVKSASGDVRMIVADETTLYWAEPTTSGWSIRSTKIP